MTKPYFDDFDDLLKYFNIRVEIHNFNARGEGFRYACCNSKNKYFFEPDLQIDLRSITRHNRNGYALHDGDKKLILDKFNKLAKVYIPKEDSNPIDQIRHYTFILSNLLHGLEKDSVEYKYLMQSLEKVLKLKETE